MKRIFLTLTLSILFLSTSAIDLNTWEFFSAETAALALSPQGDRMARMYAPVATPASRLNQIYDPATKDWLNANAPFVLMPIKKLYISSTEEFHVNHQMKMYVRPKGSSNSWTQVNVNVIANDFAPSTTDNKIWFLKPNVPGFIVQYLNRATGAITNLGTDAIKITVDAAGNPWIINSSGNILSYSGSSWTTRPGKAREITAGAHGVYIVSQDVAEGGFAIKKWNAAGNSWTTIPGIGGINVTTTFGSTQHLYVMTNENKAYRMKGPVSSFCPMCTAGWQTPEGNSYEGYCKPGVSQCINCLSGTAAAETTTSLKCEVCPVECTACSTLTTCTSCKNDYTLGQNGKCGGPCVDEVTDTFYYPSDNSCRSTCEIPIVDTSVTFPKCQLCPDYNCWECTIPTFCTQCSSTHFLSPLGTCMASCPAPLVSSEPSPGDKRCKEPCGTDLYYDPDNDVCQV